MFANLPGEFLENKSWRSVENGDKDRPYGKHWPSRQRLDGEREPLRPPFSTATIIVVKRQEGKGKAKLGFLLGLKSHSVAEGKRALPSDRNQVCKRLQQFCYPPRINNLKDYT